MVSMIDGGIFVTSGKSVAVFQLNGMGNVMPKMTTPSDDTNRGSKDWELWGDNDQYPADVVTKVDKNPVLSRSLLFRKEAHIAHGLVPVKKNTDGTMQPVDNKEITTFFANSRMPLFYNGLVDDYYLHKNYFVEVIMSKDGKKIASVNRRDPVHSRWGRMPENKDHVTDFYFSYNFPNPQKKPLRIEVLNEFQPVKQLKERGHAALKGKSFIIRVPFKTRGQVYYNKPEWHGLLDGWLSISNSIPVAVKSLMENQMLIKWHVEIEAGYWERKFSDWATLTKTEQEERIKGHLQIMDDFLSDTENAGKAFISYFRVDGLDQKTQVPDIKLTALDNKLQDLKYITEFQRAANSEVLFGIGLDGTLVGQNSPGGSESGSGSNKREAMWVNQQVSNLHRTLTTSPWWDVVAEFNGWYGEHLAHREIDTSQTIDKNPDKTTDKLT